MAGFLGVCMLVLGFLYFSLLSEWRLLNEGKYLLSMKEGLVQDRQRFVELKLRDREQEYLKVIQQLEQEKRSLQRSYQSSADTFASTRARLEEEAQGLYQAKEELAKQLAAEENKTRLLRSKVDTLVEEDKELTTRIQLLTKEKETLGAEKAKLAKEKKVLLAEKLANDPAERAKRLKAEEAGRPFRKVLDDYAQYAKEYGLRMKEVARYLFNTLCSPKRLLPSIEGGKQIPLGKVARQSSSAVPNVPRGSPSKWADLVNPSPHQITRRLLDCRFLTRTACASG